MAATVAAIVGFAASVQATPITGGISFAGGFAQVGGTAGNLASATGLTFSSVSVTPGQASGSYLALNGGYILSGLDTFGPLTLSPLTPPASLYSFTVLGVTYSFSATSISYISPSTANAVNVEGFGTASISSGGFTPTVGYWNITANQAGGITFSFSSSQSQNIPDGGTTVLLLGAALTGLFLVRKQVLA